MKPFLLGFSLLVYCMQLLGQNTFKEKALEAFAEDNYPLSIELLNKAREENPLDASVYYYLGYFSHYLMYDSRPFSGQTLEWSQKEVIANLDKALELDPQLGDARYFLGVEHGSRAWEYLKVVNEKLFRYEYQQAYNKGAFPPWLLEEGRNQLRICPTDAILFITGDLHFNAITWLQAFEGYRTDVSVVAIALLNRPWYLKAYRDGLQGISRSVPLSWTDTQLGEMQHFKWESQQINIPIPGHLNKKYDVDLSIDTMHWRVEPDLLSPGKRTFLSPAMAAFINIVEQNRWERPVFVTVSAISSVQIDNFRRQFGPLVQLMPFDTEQHELTMDDKATRDFYFNDDNFSNLPDIANNNFPRVSGVLFNHHMILLNLCKHYYDKQQWDKALEALNRIEVIFPDSILKIPKDFRQFIDELEADILTK